MPPIAWALLGALSVMLIVSLFVLAKMLIEDYYSATSPFCDLSKADNLERFLPPGYIVIGNEGENCWYYVLPSGEMSLRRYLSKANAIDAAIGHFATHVENVTSRPPKF